MRCLRSAIWRSGPARCRAPMKARCSGARFSSAFIPSPRWATETSFPSALLANALVTLQTLVRLAVSGAGHRLGLRPLFPPQCPRALQPRGADCALSAIRPAFNFALSTDGAASCSTCRRWSCTAALRWTARRGCGASTAWNWSGSLSPSFPPTGPSSIRSRRRAPSLAGAGSNCWRRKRNFSCCSTPSTKPTRKPSTAARPTPRTRSSGAANLP